MQDNLVLREAKTLEDFLILRNIRNECREFMTRDISYISEDQQIRWFEKLKDNDDNTFKIYLLFIVEKGVIVSPIGYGLIRKEGDFYIVSGGLIESCRGKGYGNKLFEYLIGNVDVDYPVKLEVLKTNTKAFVIYNKLGFRVVNDDGKIITMLYNNSSQI